MSARNALLAVIASFLVTTSCTTDPVTGRPEAVGMSEAEEKRLGAEAAEQVEARMGLVETPRLLRYLRAIGARLATASVRRGVDFHFFLIDLEEPNAFALPGGYVYVSRGLLALLNSEDELANVLAHETAHVVARHHAESAARRIPLLPVSLAVQLGAAATSVVSPRLGRAVAALGEAPGALLLASYGRAQEDEADELGQAMAAAVGWDPAAMSAVMTTLAREEALGGHDPSRQSFFSSHPTSPQRAEATRVRAGALMRGPGRPLATNARAFLGELDGLAIGPSADQGTFDGNRFLHPELDFTLEMPSGWRTDNTPAAVSAVSPDGASVVLVTLVAGTADPLEAASAAVDGGKLGFETDPEPVLVSGLQAARAIGQTGARSERVGLLVYWIAHGGRVYRIVGAAPRSSFAERRTLLDRAARSFRPLAPADRLRIRQARLRIFEAGAGDTLELLASRHASSWSPEEAAVANGLEVDRPLAAGQAIKLSIPEAYDSR